MPGPYSIHIFTGDVPGAGTDEDPICEIIGEIQGQIFFIGRLQFSGAGNRLERGHDTVPDSYTGSTNGSMLDAVSCSLSLTRNGTAGPDWYCMKIIFMDGDLGNVNDPQNWFLAVCEVNDWIRYDSGPVVFPFQIVPAIPYLLPQAERIRGPGRRLPLAQLPGKSEVAIEIAQPVESSLSVTM